MIYSDCGVLFHEECSAREWNAPRERFSTALQPYNVSCHKSSVVTQPPLERRMCITCFLLPSHMCDAVKRCKPYNLLIRDILILHSKCACAITESTISLNFAALNATLPQIYFSCTADSISVMTFSLNILYNKKLSNNCWYQRAHIYININETLSLTHNIVLLESKTKNSKFQREVRYKFTKKKKQKQPNPKTTFWP